MTKNLQTSGLLALNPEALKVFFTLLTFQHPSGDIYATDTDIATALGLSEPAAHALLQGLTAPLWNNQPLVYCTHLPEGTVRWHPSKQAVAKKTIGELGGEDTQALFVRMREVGVGNEQAKLLLETCNPAVIYRQLDWLPYRDAKSPARFLVAAITHNYDPPHHYPRLQSDVPEIPFFVEGIDLSVETDNDEPTERSE